MADGIEVRIQGRGTVRGGEKKLDPDQKAVCDLCGAAADAVASVGASGAAPFSCKNCLRVRLEAMTVGIWELRDTGDSGIPWGKISG